MTSDASTAGNQQPAAAAQPGSGAAAQPPDIAQKLNLIDYSYKEVLDATKHQDDKIGQLLTSIAFLTAATLALAALESGNFITRTFAVDPFKLPLALIALVVFLVGVAWSVMLLLASLATPLRMPGLSRPTRDRPAEWWKGVSQIYFYEISRVSLDQWKERWTAPVADLEQERLSLLIRETHNLGVRTRAKYDRTTEAVSLLSIALLAFALSIILVAIVAGTPSNSNAIVLTLWQRLIIGWVIGCYVWLQTLGRVRYTRQAVDESPARDVKSPKRRKARAEIWYAVVMGLLMIDILEYDRSWPGLSVWIVVTVILTLCYLSAFLFTSSEPRTFRETLTAVVVMVVAGGSAVIAVKKAQKGAKLAPLRKWRQAYIGRLMLVLATIFLVGWALGCGINGWYAGQLGVVCAAVLLIIGSAIMQPTSTVHTDRKRYWDGLKAAPQTVQNPISPDGT